MKANSQTHKFAIVKNCVLFLHWALGWMEGMVGGPLLAGHCEYSNPSVFLINVLASVREAGSPQKPLNTGAPWGCQSTLV